MAALMAAVAADHRDLRSKARPAASQWTLVLDGIVSTPQTRRGIGRRCRTEHRTGAEDMGGTMRLGEQKCVLNQGSLAQRLYGTGVVAERHRHRYEVNNNYVARLEACGLAVAGRSEDGELVEIIELPDHPWFLACQFHPEFTSSPRKGHPLFSGFIEAANAHALEHGTGTEAVNGLNQTAEASTDDAVN